MSTQTQRAAALRHRIETALASPATDDRAIDPLAELDTLFAGVGLDVGDTGGKVEFVGRDPIVSSPLPLATLAGVALMGKAAAVAGLWRTRGGCAQDLHLHLGKAPHRLCPFYDRRWELLNGFAPGNPADPDSPFMPDNFYVTRDGRHMLLGNTTPGLRRAALAFLDCGYDRAAIARAVAGWDALALEEEAERVGFQATMVRTPGEFMDTEQFDHVAGTPLIRIDKLSDSDPEPLAPSDRPLGGLRALGRGHVIAGAGVGRALAYHGADVLNVWRPGEYEMDLIYYTANVGMRSSLLDLDAPPGRKEMRRLLGDADIFFTNRRPGSSARHGLDRASLARARPGLIQVEISLYGDTGPWSGRVGFDQNAGAATGILTIEGEPRAPRLTEIFVVNDYALSWLAVIGIVAALRRRATDGGGYLVRLSLARVSLWLYELGLFDKRYAARVAGRTAGHEYLPPDMFEADTPCGRYRGLTDQVRMSVTLGHYDTPLMPRGAALPHWL